MRRPMMMIAAVAVLILTGCSGSSDSAQADEAEPETFEVRGEVTVVDGSVAKFGKECLLDGGGYSDIAEGASVTVYDSSGEAVAVGEVGVGSTDRQYVCVFPFTVSEVPEGEIFSVEVAERGEVRFTRDDADQVSLKLG